jgi:hypothetical protein
VPTVISTTLNPPEEASADIVKTAARVGDCEAVGVFKNDDARAAGQMIRL